MQRTGLSNNYGIKTPGGMYSTANNNFKSGKDNLTKDPYSYSNTGMGNNTASKNTYGVNKVTGNSNSTTTKKFNDNEINEAKEHLKLLKEKLGGNTFTSKGVTTNTGSNYRKPFQPAFDNDNMYGKNTGFGSGLNTVTNSRPMVKNTGNTFTSNQNQYGSI
jgi:hypothetical protein